jgi:ABC-2 type transport system permease protein
VGVISTVGVLLAAGVAALLGFLAVGNPDDGWLSLGQSLVQGPAALVFVAAAALLVGALPRVAVGVGWGLFGLGAVWGTLGGLFDPPDWTLDLSPFFTVPALPADDWSKTLLVASIAVAAGAAALVTVRRRDLTT